MPDNVTVIIRTVGERTEALCKKLVLEQGIAGENVVFVREAPFSKALEKSFQVGLERGLPWTMCVDADLLLRPYSIKKLVEFGNKQKPEVCEFQGLVLDKFFGGPRPAGNHLYRTVHLKKALEMIPEEGINIRPEFHTLKRMKLSGFPWYNTSLLMGIHDFEQHYRDIYRKTFVYAHKYYQNVDLFLVYWREMLKNDPDFMVALKGLANGICHYDKVHIDINQSYYAEFQSQVQIKEKGLLDINRYSTSDIQDIINSWKVPEKYLEKFPEKYGYDERKVKKIGRRHIIKNKLRKTGYTGFIPWMLGWTLKRAGILICDRFERGA